MTCPVLSGTHVRMEPLIRAHVGPLLRAAGQEASLYRWSYIPQDLPGMGRYVDTALAARASGTAFPFATVRVADGVVIGSSRFFDIERWAWPEGHPESRREGPDGCEIGYTWLSAGAIRTAANTEAKLLMLTQAFEVWGVKRVCFHTDARNERSRAALERIGAQFEGILRAHRLASDLIARDSARYSILAAEWPQVRAHLQEKLARAA
ncbi:MAG TPA: GNAT family protein [Candidatus Dormibacteraeota bacterium]|nr:GNAT family protein [Candidatus Dormibacteraeota bacterium]